MKRLQRLQLVVFLISANNVIELVYYIWQTETWISKNSLIYFLERFNFAIIPALISLCFFSKRVCRSKSRHEMISSHQQSNNLDLISSQTLIQTGSIHQSLSQSDPIYLDTSHLSRNFGVSFKIMSEKGESI